MKSSQIEAKYFNNSTLDQDRKRRRWEKICSKRLKKERIKLYSNQQLSGINNDNKTFWKTMKASLIDSSSQSFRITLAYNDKLILDNMNKPKRLKLFL